MGFVFGEVVVKVLGVFGGNVLDGVVDEGSEVSGGDEEGERGVVSGVELLEHGFNGGVWLERGLNCGVHGGFEEI